jgi:N-acetylglutamate synthase-like GNAT family acetyltransferase
VDVIDILALVSPHIATGNLLPLDSEYILHGLDNWIVAERPDSVLVGCGSLVRYNGVFAELRSLVVAPSYHGRGIGTEIVLRLLDRARMLGLREVFALTRAGAFFTRLGFAPAKLEQFPEKARHDCALCPRQHCCDEEAFTFHLESLQ